MIPTPTMPIRTNWTTNSTQIARQHVTAAAEIAQSLGGCTVAELADYRAEISAVVADLAQRSGVSWPIEKDEPLVGLLRTLGHVAVRWPDVATPLGHPLLELLAHLGGVRVPTGPVSAASTRAQPLNRPFATSGSEQV